LGICTGINSAAADGVYERLRGKDRFRGQKGQSVDRAPCSINSKRHLNNNSKKYGTMNKLLIPAMAAAICAIPRDAQKIKGSDTVLPLAQKGS
jgi:hypothetical protein